jgi:hypothetical protein
MGRFPQRDSRSYDCCLNIHSYISLDRMRARGSHVTSKPKVKSSIVVPCRRPHARKYGAVKMSIIMKSGNVEYRLEALPNRVSKCGWSVVHISISTLGVPCPGMDNDSRVDSFEISSRSMAESCL